MDINGHFHPRSFLALHTTGLFVTVDIGYVTYEHRAIKKKYTGRLKIFAPRPQNAHAHVLFCRVRILNQNSEFCSSKRDTFDDCTR